MFDEVTKRGRLEVTVVVEWNGAEVTGIAQGSAQDRLTVVARAALSAARAASPTPATADFVGVARGELGGFAYVTVLIQESGPAEPLIGSAAVRPHEDEAKATIRSVFAAVNRRFQI